MTDPEVQQMIARASELLQQGNYQEAIKSYRNVLDMNAALPQAWHGLGSACCRAGDYANAEWACRNATRLAPEMANAHQLLAIVLHAQKKYLEAIESYSNNLRLNPDNAETHARLGLVKQALGRHEEALRCYERALELSPNQPRVMFKRGDCLQQLKRLPEAEVVYRELLVTMPDSLEVIARLAYLCEQMHEIEKAATFVEQGLARDENNAALLLTQAKLVQRDGKTEEAIQTLEKVLTLDIEPEIMGEVHTRLGYLHDRAGVCDKAFSYFVSGNEIANRRFSGRGIDKNWYLDSLDSLQALLIDGLALTVPVPVPVQETELASSDPVFLVGFPRSGTTLLDQILDSHPQIQTMEERPCVEAMVQEFLRVSNGRERPLASLTTHEVRRLREVYFSEVDRHIKILPGNTFIDKFPLNIASVHIIWKIFPNAKFILALRHPCDACLSCFMHSFGANIAMANFLLLEDTIAVYAKIFSFWQRCVAMLPLQCHAIKYEDVVVNMESETRSLVRFLGLNWDPAVLEYTDHAKQRGMINTPSYDQVTQPLYRHARYRWKRYEEFFAPHMDQLERFISYFGY